MPGRSSLEEAGTGTTACARGRVGSERFTHKFAIGVNAGRGAALGDDIRRGGWILRPELPELDWQNPFRSALIEKFSGKEKQLNVQ